MNWWHKNSDYKQVWLILVLMVVLFAILFLQVILTYQAHAAACLSIDVPPQAVLSNHDGDTFTLFSFAPGGTVKIRVEGVDTPELSESRGDLAKEFTRQWLAKGVFQLETCGKPTLGRIVGKVSRHGRTLAQDLIDVGLVK